MRAAAVALLGASDSDGPLACVIESEIRTPMPVRIDLRADGGVTRAVFVAEMPEPVPYFNWLVAPNLRRLSRQLLRWTADRLAAYLERRDPPPPLKRSLFSTPTAFEHDQAVALATICALTLVAGIGSSLFSQNVDFISDSYDVSDRTISIAGAVTRVGVLVALVATALADRLGRRRLLLVSVSGVCAASALSALAPTMELFTAAQLLSRGFFNAAFVVGLVGAVEEAPERGRAFAVAMVTLAFGGGGAVSTALLPLGDLAPEAWRVSFAINGLMLLAIPGFARNLRETQRYSRLVVRAAVRGRPGELLAGDYRLRLALMLALALLTNVLAAPSAQLANEFLGDERGFSGLQIALFRGVTGGIPGFVGLFYGGRLAETVGRKVVAVVATVGTSLTTAAFFLSDGLALWLFGTVDVFLVAVAAPALQAFGPEMFPTEVRGTANAVLLVTGLLGSATGLVVAGQLSETMELGRAIAVLGVAPVLGALLCIPWLPEASEKDLDVVSPPLV